MIVTAFSVASLAFLIGTASGASRPELPVAATTRFDIGTLVPEDLLRKANRGRDVVRPDGYFAFPRGVKRVWIDVGAHFLETTGKKLQLNRDLALIAIEPLSECWETWPATDRLIGLPVAISPERGLLEFHVNAFDQTSSLLKSTPGTPFDKLTHTVEVRSVPALRLEDVIERIPPDLEIDLVKVDVQGLDLQVLQSAGEQLRRVCRARMEVLTVSMYENNGEEKPATEKEMNDFMTGMGFRFVKNLNVEKDRRWLDKQYANTRCR